ncbi:hypothetical protein [Amycolatopsis sulphurea]|nr:hypothetical protein [Amycolatopsis sulphurea]
MSTPDGRVVDGARTGFDGIDQVRESPGIYSMPVPLPPNRHRKIDTLRR